MHKLRKTLKNKIKSSRGMSLGEILAAVLILLLSTSLLVTTVSLGLRQYVNTLSRSEANELSSTLQSIMTNELAYTTEIHVNNDGKTVMEFQSQNYAMTGNLSTFYSDDGGKVWIGKQSDTTNSVKLLGDGSYPNKLEVKDISITYSGKDDDTESKDDYIFTISFKIGRTGQSDPILTQEFQVINVNKTKADLTTTT